MTERPAGAALDALPLSNVKADRVKHVRALAGRSARDKAGHFLVEGPQSVREAVRFAGARVRELYVTEAAATRFAEIVAQAVAAGITPRLGTPEVLAAMSGDCQGVLAVVDSVEPALDEVVAGKPRLVSVLSNVRDPGNAGTAIRVADAAGADAVLLVGDSVDPTSPKVVRASAGSVFHIPVVRSLAIDEAARALRTAGLRVLAADGTGNVVLGEHDGHGVDLGAPTVWVFGNEAWGLSAEELALADTVVSIPIYGDAESLNLAAAVAVCLYSSAAAHAATKHASADRSGR